MGERQLAIGVLGAGGRMGRALVEAIAAAPDLALAGGVERPGHPACGAALPGGLVVAANAAPVAHRADVLVDFTTPEALAETLRAAGDAGCALVVGTTGLGPEHHAAIDAAAQTIAVLQAANTSLGVTLLSALVEMAASRLPDWDIEIAELHHGGKRDAPSGTALMLGEAAARGRGKQLQALRLRPHDGMSGPRVTGGIGFAALRGGTAAGDHDVWLLGTGERLRLAHVAEDRRIFATGALTAARWLAGRPAGRYRMSDILGFSAR
ncbi:4-hydroxy-tetrahydrodipicolinate reductase [Thermaurantiacus sp.]